MSMDINRAGTLLHIVEKCAGHSGKLGSLASAAMDELLAINEQLRLEAVKAAAEQKAKDDAEAKAKADAAAKQKADEEAKDETARRAIIARQREGARVIPAQTLGLRSEEADAKVPVYPNDSNTATIADRRL